MLISRDYTDWLTRQSDARVLHSVRMMRLSRIYGKAQRTHPSSDRAKRLAAALHHHRKNTPA